MFNGQDDIFEADIDSGNIINITNDDLYEKTPIWSPDGKFIYYTTRIHSIDQIMRMSSTNHKQVEQLTFSNYNSTSPAYDPQCDCLPVGSTACSQRQCGGVCPAGEECVFFAFPLTIHNGCRCRPEGPPGPCGSGGNDCL